MSDITIHDSIYAKMFGSDNYSYVFSKTSGSFARWGKTVTDDPTHSPYGPELLDIEISEVCSNGCKFCYKSNEPYGQNMSLSMFKEIIHKIPATLTQVAFGIGDIEGNPDLFPILDYTRKMGYIPNLTIHGGDLTKEHAEKFAKVLGGIAVSWYDKTTATDAIMLLREAGLKSINIHFMLSEETYEQALQLIHDPILRKVQALVFLSLKQKGRGVNHTPLSEEKFKKLITISQEDHIPIGFDSCSAFKYLRNAPDPSAHLDRIESCESTRFSLYINVEGKVFPCSFAENTDFTGIPILSTEGIWNHPSIVKFRKHCIECKDDCPLGYTI